MNGSRVVAVRLNNNLFYRVRKLSNKYNISNSMVIRDLLSNIHDLPHLVTRLDAKRFSAKYRLLDALNRNYESLKSLSIKSYKLIGFITPSSMYGTDSDNSENETILKLNRLVIEAVRLVHDSIGNVSRIGS